jgi:hypothetical protein
VGDANQELNKPMAVIWGVGRGQAHAVEKLYVVMMAETLEGFAEQEELRLGGQIM